MEWSLFTARNGGKEVERSSIKGKGLHIQHRQDFTAYFFNRGDKMQLAIGWGL